MRNIKELLQVMLDNQQLFISGLCWWNAMLYSKDIVTNEEYRLIKSFIKENRPKNRSKYDYYWEQGNIFPRIEFIKKHLK